MLRTSYEERHRQQRSRCGSHRLLRPACEPHAHLPELPSSARSECAGTGLQATGGLQGMLQLPPWSDGAPAPPCAATPACTGLAARGAPLCDGAAAGRGGGDAAEAGPR